MTPRDRPPNVAEHRHETAGRLVVVACAATAAALATLALVAGTAQASSVPYSSPYFNPTISVTASTAQAGAHPHIEIRMRKPPDHCQEPFREVEDGGPKQICDEAYIEQHLRDFTLSLPPGLMVDPNATPVQCDNPQFEYDEDAQPIGYQCPRESKIGEVFIITRECFKDEYPWKKKTFDGCYVYDSPWDSETWLVGELFNGLPQAGEQGRLHTISGVLLEKLEDGQYDYYHPIRTDGVAKLRTQSDWGIDSITTDVPDAMPRDPKQPALYGASIYEFRVALFGSVGAERGHPLITNPTSCQPRQLGATFTGYGTNSWVSGNYGSLPGFGTGLTVPASTPYPVTGCNLLSYDPKLSLSLDPAGPSQPAAITSTVTQAVGEQTTKHVEVRLPRSFKVNFANSLAQCSADQAAARSCPQEAKVGEVAAETSLLPETGDFAGPLRGEVFIGETTATDIRVYILLHGFVDATLQGSVTMNADGSSQVSFDLPEVPQQKITLSLLGGKDKGLVTTPKTCGTHTLDTTFTSHQGTERTLKVPVEVSCTEPSFDVGLSTRRPRAHPTLTLATGSSGLSSVRFDLPAAMKVGQRPGRLKTLGSYGALSLDGEGVPRELKLKLMGVGRKGQLSFAAAQAGAALTSLSGKRVNLGGRKRVHGKSSGRPLRLNLGELPPGTTGTSLELAGNKDGLLKNPSACRKRGLGHRPRRLGFTAHIVTTDGKAYKLHRSLAMSCKRSGRGRGR